MSSSSSAELQGDTDVPETNTMAAEASDIPDSSNNTKNEDPGAVDDGTDVASATISTTDNNRKDRDSNNPDDASSASTLSSMPDDGVEDYDFNNEDEDGVIYSEFDMESSAKAGGANEITTTKSITNDPIIPCTMNSSKVSLKSEQVSQQNAIATLPSPAAASTPSFSLTSTWTSLMASMTKPTPLPASATTIHETHPTDDAVPATPLEPIVRCSESPFESGSTSPTTSEVSALAARANTLNNDMIEPSEKGIVDTAAKNATFKASSESSGIIVPGIRVLPLQEQPASHANVFQARVVESMATEPVDNPPPPPPPSSQSTGSSVPESSVRPIFEQPALQPILSQATVVESLTTEQVDNPPPAYVSTSSTVPIRSVLSIPDEPASQPTVALATGVESLTTGRVDNTSPPLPFASEPTCISVPGSYVLVLPIPDQPASQPIDSRVESLITEEADNTPPPLPMASEPTCNGVPGSRVLVLPIPDQSASQPIISQAAVVESLETEQLDFPSPPHELSPKPVAPESSATETMLVCVDTDLPAPSLSTAATSATPGLSKSDAVAAASMQRARSLYTALVQASMQTTDLSLATGVNNGSIINPTADAHTTSDTFPTNSATDESRSHRVDSGERDRQLDESTILFQRDATTSYFNVQRNSDLLALDSSNIRLTTLPVDYESPDIESNPPVGSLLALLVANDSLPPPPADVLDSRAHCATKDSKRNRRITPCRVLLLLALGILVCALVGVCGVAGRCHRRISNDTSATILSNSTTTTSSYADRATGGDAARTNGTLPTSTMPYITKSSFTSLSELKMSVDAFLLGSESVVPIAEWDVVAITDFSHLFDADRTGVDTFNENLSGWDVSSALSLDGMFYGQVNFLGTGLAVWDVSNVVSMRGTFELASSFNADLSNWDVSNVKYMSYLFAESAFAGDLSSWKVDHVTDTSFLFFGLTKFNSDLSAWHVDRVVDMAYMFNECTGFRNRDLSKWKTSNVLTMAQMFEQSSFIGDISTWDTSHVVTMESMFDRSAFQGDISEWDVSNVENMDRMFRGSRFNRDLSKWNVSKVTSMYKTFSESNFTNDVSDWDTSLVANMNYAFANNSLFNGNLSRWTVARVISMDSMFEGAERFEGIGLDNWDVSSVQSMSSMFAGASIFDQDLSVWNVSQVSFMNTTFRDAVSFRGFGLENWDVRKVETMQSMFDSAASFQGNLSGWQISRVVDFSWMFIGCTSFRGDLSRWNTSSAETMASMFNDAINFNSNIGAWDVSKVYDMSAMFEEAAKFTGKGMAAWDVSNVEYMYSMFDRAPAFAANVADWNVGKCFDFDSMFSNNPSFNLDLSSWDVASAEYMGYMFAATALNYSYCAWGERVPSDVDVTEMFSQTNCPDVNDPDTASLAGSSWCYSC